MWAVLYQILTVYTRLSFGVGVRWSRFLHQYDFVWLASGYSANYGSCICCNRGNGPKKLANQPKL